MTIRKSLKRNHKNIQSLWLVAKRKVRMDSGPDPFPVRTLRLAVIPVRHQPVQRRLLVLMMESMPETVTVFPELPSFPELDLVQIDLLCYPVCSDRGDIITSSIAIIYN